MSALGIFAQAVKAGNSVINVTVGGVEYIAEALPTASPTDAAWRCTAIFPLEGGGRFVKHAAGFAAPGWNGENLSDLTYHPVQPVGE